VKASDEPSEEEKSFLEQSLTEPKEAGEEYHFTFLRVGTVWVVLNAIQTVTVFMALIYFIRRT